jgi:cell division protein YceG involved in septum cleavage
LYPDTYTIDTTVFKINNFVILQLDTFETKVYNKIFKDTQLSVEQIQDVVNLASIVEKEERNPKEKSTVAGILKKRLNA